MTPSQVNALGASTFNALDGNLTDDCANETDWCTPAPNRTVGTDTPSGPGDSSFVSGPNKEDHDVPTVGAGSIPNNKDDLLREFVCDPRSRIRSWFDPATSLMTGVVENQDAYMKGRIGQRTFYARVPGALDEAFATWARLTGRRYGPVQAYRTEDATEVLVAMGTIADTATAVVDHLRAQGRQVGCVAVTA